MKFRVLLLARMTWKWYFNESVPRVIPTQSRSYAFGVSECSGNIFQAAKLVIVYTCWILRAKQIESICDSFS